MSKIVRKIRPSEYWRIGEHESYFSDMSLMGLHLHKIGTHFIHFKKGEPNRIEYRMEVTKKKSISYEQIDLYEENGWEHVTSYQYFHVFSSPEESNAPEIHTDPAEQAYTLQQLSKILLVNLIAMSLIVPLSIGLLSATWFLDGTPVLRLVEGRMIQQSIMGIILLYYVYYSIGAARAIRSLKRDLKEGKAINHHAPWQNSLHKNSVLPFIFFGVALVSTILPVMQLIKMDTYTLPQEDIGLPIVRLADIEQNPLLKRDEYYIDEVDWANRYSTNWGIFAPVQYEVDESGIVEDKVWLDDGSTYSPTITSKVYKLTFQSLVEPLISDLIKWHSYEKEMDLYIERKHATLDKLMVYEENGMKKIVAAKGDVVMYVRYIGYAEFDLIIENIAQKLATSAEK
ncbi:DUF2812 domain-containing protein [Solibacillus sp. A46]|uniref:DUF2812 domain-containing protein n=1 Tax=Solibacillus faecavium TaxID=2762221 RepID=A0ABR8XVA1_9BACL|nr:DUF2812 domain-containing protein [Solibacillus faecavium]MBD8035869.1 DUF2812 domain-containing protein [Solibacillus faecavium]